MSNNTSLRPRTVTVAIGVLVLTTIALASILASGADRAAARSGGVGTGGETRTGGKHNLTPAKYHRLWDRVKRKDRRWAARVAECESGRDPNAVALNGRYRGAFMFTRDAWKTSPKSPGGDPVDYSYRTQAVVAVHLKKRDGTRPWPVCG
ncbi:MAG: hypothetical protein EDQ89_08270 [Acidobacteria bacterium]|nr:MAG: hypothetical protein EDQ89_08270 [Acidobacteriota bacterium]MCL4287071.1 transglycosylase family protein [Thermoleophilia bacterium]GIK77443.1 MAG: hypothetical protein BroJett022_11330 [Actinomycetes bacterium]